MNTDPSAPKDTTRTRLDKYTTNSATISALTSQNLRLTGEVAILRQNLLTLERENYQLKAEKNNKHLVNFKDGQKLKKELEILKYENRINENRLRAFKKSRIVDYDNTDYKWLFTKINSEVQFKIYPIDLNRLEILNSYFYDDFIQIGDINNIEDGIREFNDDFDQMCKLFIIFSSRKNVFDKLFKFMFEIYLEQKNTRNAGNLYYILCYCELDWILRFVENDAFMTVFNEFLDYSINEKMAVLFYAKIAKVRPALFTIFMNNDRFLKILENNYTFIDLFLDLIPVSSLENYVNAKSIMLINKKLLKKIYDDYFEIF